MATDSWLQQDSLSKPPRRQAPLAKRTIINVVNCDLAGIGSRKNAPRSVPNLEWLSGERFKPRSQS